MIQDFIFGNLYHASFVLQELMVTILNKYWMIGVYSSAFLVRPLPPRAIPFLRPDFRCVIFF